MGNFGSRRKLYNNQRLTPDLAEGLRDAPFDDRETVDGGLMGACEGVITAASATFEEVGPFKSLRFGPMVLCGYKNAGAATDRASGGLVPFIPTDPHQVQTIVEISGYEGSTGALWWRSALVEADLGNYAEIQAGFPQGKIKAGNLMLRHRVYLDVTANFDTPPAGGETWYRLGIVDWTDEESDPVVTFCHAFDLGFESSVVTEAGKWLGQSMMQQFDAESNVGRSYAIVRALATLANVVMAIKDRDHAWDLESNAVTTAGAEDLLVRTYRGLKQLDEDLSVVEAALSASEDTPVSPVGFVGMVRFDGGTEAFILMSAGGGTEGDLADLVGVATSVQSEGHKATFTVSNLPTGINIVGIDVRPYSSVGITEFPIHSNILPSTALPFVGDGSTEFTFDVLFWHMNQGETVATGDEYQVVDPDFTVTIYVKRL